MGQGALFNILGVPPKYEEGESELGFQGMPQVPSCTLVAPQGCSTRALRRYKFLSSTLLIPTADSR